MESWSAPVPVRIRRLPLLELVSVTGNPVVDLGLFARAVVMPGRGAVIEAEAFVLLFLEVLRVSGGRERDLRECVDAVALFSPEMVYGRLRALRESPEDSLDGFLTTVAMRSLLRSRNWVRMLSALRTVRRRLSEDKAYWTPEGVRYTYLERGLRVFFGTHPEHFERLDATVDMTPPAAGPRTRFWE